MKGAWFWKVLRPTVDVCVCLGMKDVARRV